MPNLQDLNLSQTWISPKGLAPLAGLANLKQLDLRSCRRIDDSAIGELAKCKALRVPSIWRTRESPAITPGAAKLASELFNHLACASSDANDDAAARAAAEKSVKVVFE